MSRTRRLPIGRAVPRDQAVEPSPGQRVVLVDLDLLRKTKTYANLKKQVASWGDEAIEDYILGMIAEGPV